MTILAQRASLSLDTLTDLWTPSFLFLLVAATLQPDPRLTSDVCYILIAVFVLGALLLGFRRHRRLDRERFSTIPLILMGLWVYGVILGLSNHVPYELVFRNFAAMSLFFVYYAIVLLAPTLQQVQAGLIAGAAAFVLAGVFVFLTGETKGSVETIGFIAIRYHYFLGSLIAAAVMLSLSVRSVVIGPFRFAHLLFAAAIFWVIFLSGSRAYYVAVAATMLVLIGCFGASSVDRLVRSICLGFGYALFGLVLLIGTTGVVNSMAAFSQSVAMEVDALSPRSEQFNALLAEITLFGSGLGAPLKSGFARDKLGYGFELSYLSLAHKVGLIGLLVYAGCAVGHVIRAVVTLVRSDYSSYMISALSLMCFLISAWSNPFLFAPVFVCMFCVSLYVERTTAKDLAAASKASRQ